MASDASYSSSLGPKDGPPFPVANWYSQTWLLLLTPAWLTWVLSVAFRIGDWSKTYPSIEATYHSLLTMQALLENPLDDHLGLPTVSLGGPENHGIPWGATVPTQSGAYIYTSFPPLPWLLPSLVLKVSGGQVDLVSLFWLGALLGLFSTTLAATCGWLLARNLIRIGSWKGPIFIGFVTGSLYAFTPEVLLSQGALYWPHALAQVFWLVTILGVILVLAELKFRVGKWIVVGGSFLFCITEWSGYIASAGLVVAFGVWSMKRRNSNFVGLASGVFIATVFAAVLTTAHFAAGVGLDPLLRTWEQRFLARSGVSSNPLVLSDGLWSGLGQSLGIGLIVLSVLAVIALGNKDSKPNRVPSDVALTVILLSAIPLLENLLIMQHAVQFSFDRLKWVVPIVLAVAFVVCEYAGKRAAIPIILVTAASLAGLVGYKGQLESLTGFWWPYAQANESAKDWTTSTLGQQYACATFTSNGGVRGYLNTTFGRGIYEWVPDLEAARSLTAIRGGCATVYIVTSGGLVDVPIISQVFVTDSSAVTKQWSYPE